jgi:hypothetical protein
MHRTCPENKKNDTKLRLPLWEDSSHRQLVEAQNTIDVNKRDFSAKRKAKLILTIS